MAMPPAPTASFAKIDEFDPATDSWDIYCERLHHCFTVRNIDENATELKRPILLSEMGKTAYRPYVTQKFVRARQTGR